jgi:cytochrome P450
LTFKPRDSSLFAHGKRDPLFARLRECDTLAVDRDGTVPIYSLVRYADVERAYKEPHIFSPCAGLTLDAFDPKVCETPSRMLEMAPPEPHRQLKGAMQGAFRGSGLAEIRQKTEEHLDRFLATAIGSDTVEFVDSYARDAAALMMSELLGLLPAEQEQLAPVFGKIGELDAGESPASVLRRQKGEFRLLRDLTRIVRTHRAEGLSEGLLGRLLGAELEAEPLSDHDVALNCFNVVAAGTGASQHTLAGAAAVWADHPGAMADAAADPKLTRRLVDETLRWLTPVLHLTRILTAEVEIRGQRLPRGAGVCLWNISANRDEEVFEDATSFRPERPPGRNMAFGAGPQYCLGAEVVRMQLEVLLIGMARRGAHFELAAPPVWMRSNALAGVESLYLRLRGPSWA